MELQEFREVWKKEKKELVDRIEVSENRLKKISLQKAKSKFDHYLKMSIVGRTLALVYAIISFCFFYKGYNNLLYSIPALIGGLAMLFSFYQHLALKKPNYNVMNIVEFQKAIHNLRIHLLKHAKYDKAIVILWFLTITPIYMKAILKVSLFASLKNFILYFSIIAVVLCIIILISSDVYKKWNTELEEHENNLKEIKEFELN